MIIAGRREPIVKPEIFQKWNALRQRRSRKERRFKHRTLHSLSNRIFQTEVQHPVSAAWVELTGDGEWRANDQVFARPAVRTRPLTVGPISSRSLVWSTLCYLFLFYFCFFRIFEFSLRFLIKIYDLGFSTSSKEREKDRWWLYTRRHSSEQREGEKKLTKLGQGWL